jgi:hypothetical protein
MANNISYPQADILGMKDSALTDNSELHPSPPEGANIQEERGFDIDFGTSGLDNQLNHMEFGQDWMMTQLPCHMVAMIPRSGGPID